MFPNATLFPAQPTPIALGFGSPADARAVVEEAMVDVFKMGFGSRADGAAVVAGAMRHPFTGDGLGRLASLKGPARAYLGQRARRLLPPG